MHCGVRLTLPDAALRCALFKYVGTCTAIPCTDSAALFHIALSMAGSDTPTTPTKISASRLPNFVVPDVLGFALCCELGPLVQLVHA